MENSVAYVDVDDTLVRSIGTRRIPMPRVVENVRWLRAEGATLDLCSSGGPEYAKASAEELGIADCFVGFLPKPTLIIDDQAVCDIHLQLAQVMEGVIKRAVLLQTQWEGGAEVPAKGAELLH